MSLALLKSKGRAVTVLGWIGLLTVTVAVTAVFERQRLFAELQTEAEILHRLASQRADQHDAHLTSLSALAVGGEIERQDLFLDVAATIQRFYPRIVAIDLVPLDQPDRYITTRPGLPDDMIETITAAALASDGELSLRSSPDTRNRYLAVKRSPNTDIARFGLALTVDADALLVSDANFWAQPSVARRLSLPSDKLLFGDEPQTAMQFRKPLGSRSQPLVLEAGISPQMFDLLPLGRILMSLGVTTALYVSTILALRQVLRTRRAERAARLSADDARLAHASRVNALGEMASGMAHELTQPLTAILSQAQAGRHLARRGDTGATETSLAHIIEQAKRAAAILDRLRDWTRPQLERIEEVPLNEAIENVESLLRRDVEQEGVTLTTDLSETRGVSLRLDRIALEQIVFNLARNAVDAASESIGRWVRITSRPTDTGILLDVADSGTGVLGTIRDRLFEPFVTGKPDGTGLGLALCQRLTERMGGELILVDGSADTLFRLWLPNSEAQGREVAD